MICEVIIIFPARAVFHPVYVARRAGNPTGWTLGGAIQEHIDVYISQNTFKEVQRTFPYLVAKEFASGGGDVGLPESESTMRRRIDLWDG